MMMAAAPNISGTAKLRYFTVFYYSTAILVMSSIFAFKLWEQALGECPKDELMDY